MPTYRVKALPVAPHYPLSCEGCGKTVGIAGSPAQIEGLSADAILGLWPELRQAIETHEAACAAVSPIARKKSP